MNYSNLLIINIALSILIVCLICICFTFYYFFEYKKIYRSIKSVAAFIRELKLHIEKDLKN